MNPRRLTSLFALSLIAAFAGSPCRAAEEPAPKSAAPIRVFPATLDLRHARQPHSLQVLGTTADGYNLDLSGIANFASADPRVATVDQRGWVQPVGNGETRITITVDGPPVTVPVKVQLP